MSITKRFKSYFLRGLAVLLPTILTIWILLLAYRFIRDNLAIHVSKGLAWLIGRVPVGSAANETTRDAVVSVLEQGLAGSIFGFLISLVIVFIVGALLASVLGRVVWRFVEEFIMSTPILRRVYPYVKQITDFVLTPEEQQKMFSRVVAVEYPRKGIWSIGFVTGSGLRKVTDQVQKEFLTVLVPNSPTPITGYVILVPKEQTISLDVSVEEAIRFAISAGVVAPESQRTAALPNGSAYGRRG